MPEEANDRSTDSAVSAYRLDAVEKIIRPDSSVYARFRHQNLPQQFYVPLQEEAC